MWDDKGSNLFDISSNSLKSAPVETNQMPDLSKNLSGSSGDPWSPSPMGGVNTQSQSANGFKPNIDGGMLLNQMNMGPSYMQ